MTQMTNDALRVFVYDRVISRGDIPSSGEIASHFGVTAEDVRHRIATLKIGKTILPHPETGEIWMAGPFASQPSGYPLTDGETTWQANCAWDAFGVAALAGRPLVAESTCLDCGETLRTECNPERAPASSAGVVHFLVQGRHWYDDIGFT